MNNIIFLMGATASGKTELAIEIYKNFKVDLISVDSTQIYKGMDIGSAKPNKDTLKKYPHKLINICDPSEYYSAHNFCNDAKKAIEESFKNNKTPLLVGGTSFYFRALEYGLSDMPRAQSHIRDKLLKDLKNKGINALHKDLAKIDIKASEKIHKNDTQRILRALEVYLISGITLTDLQKNKAKNKIKYPVKKIILMPKRSIAHKIIEKRFLNMLDNGLIAEVERLYKRDDLNKDLPAMRSIGYRQVWQYLDGEYSYDEMIEKAIIATRQLFKRQSTWLRSEKNAYVVEDYDLEKILTYLKDLLIADYQQNNQLNY